tara:strand:- start:957 stop:1415 length:459 start_codon:yes stop_codon:yes gene_type:complete
VEHLIGVRILGYIKGKHMELIYFISGILTVGIVYGVVLFQKIKFSHTELLETSQSLLNISSIRSAEFEEKLGDLKILIVDIQSSMEKDQYKSLSDINKRIKELEGLTSSINKRMGESNKVFNKNITDTLTQIAGIRNNIKALSQDPNMSSKY